MSEAEQATPLTLRQQKVLDQLQKGIRTWDQLRALIKINNEVLGFTIGALLNQRKIWTAHKNDVRVYGLERRTGLVPRAFTHRGVPLIIRDGKRKASQVSEKEALQNAADEARKVARAAREFGRFLDEYAKHLTHPTWRARAVELHVSALNKLSDINAGLIATAKWVAESSKIVVAQPPQQATVSGAGGKQDAAAPASPRPVRIRRKGSTK